MIDYDREDVLECGVRESLDTFYRLDFHELISPLIALYYNST